MTKSKGSTIWIDADACPRGVKEILYRAAQRIGAPLVLVANQPLWTPPSQLIRSVLVPGGHDVADAWIADHMAPGDLVITADIPLAAMVVERGGTALDPRGHLYTAENVRERLSMRDFMADLRGAGVETGGPRPWGKNDQQSFANALDRTLTGLFPRPRLL
ncbi:MAG: YaiI/YqxD family protein [Nitrospinae bacterium]|nr:YaiI/YqxD family protein [Nitrospinota bacterium]